MSLNVMCLQILCVGDPKVANNSCLLKIQTMDQYFKIYENNKPINHMPNLSSYVVCQVFQSI